MAGKHRTIHQQTTKIALAGVATATVTAITAANVAPTPNLELAQVQREIRLAAGFSPFPPPNDIPDLTGGLGTFAYNFNQALADAVLRAVAGVNLAALADAAGSNLGSLLLNLPGAALNEVLGAVPIDLAPLINQVLPGVGGVLIQILDALGITDGAGQTTLTGLLGLLGLTPSDGLDLANLTIPGVRLITAGSPFTLLKILGTDLGWVPGLPNSLGAAINSTPYIKVGVNGLLETLQTTANEFGDPVVAGTVAALIGTIRTLVPDLPDLPDLVDLRVPITAAFGIGAFAAGMSFPQIIADLKNQPVPLVTGVTVLPLVLLRNLGRANGGILARAYPLARLLGIDTVTPETQATNGGGLPILGTGIALGAQNIIPIKIDATVRYDFLSDFPSWPNAFALFNSAVGFALPTHLLRGIDTTGLTGQILDQVTDAVGNATNLNQPLGLNLYLTLPTATLPLLEPLYLLSDVTQLATFGLLPTNPFAQLANALAPAMTSLANLGYTDVVRQPDGSYIRTFTNPGDPTGFFTVPDVNWGQVVPDVLNQLVAGFQKEFFSGNPTGLPPSALTGLVNLVTGLLNSVATGAGGILGGGLGGVGGGLAGNPLGGLVGGLGGLVGGLGGLLGGLLNPLTNKVTSPPPNALMAANSRMVTLSTETENQDAQSLSKSGSLDEEKGDVKPGDVQGRTDPTGASGSELSEQDQAGGEQAQPGGEEGKPGDEEGKPGKPGNEDGKPGDEQGSAGGHQGFPVDSRVVHGTRSRTATTSRAPERSADRLRGTPCTMTVRARPARRRAGHRGMPSPTTATARRPAARTTKRRAAAPAAPRAERAGRTRPPPDGQLKASQLGSARSRESHSTWRVSQDPRGTPAPAHIPPVSRRSTMADEPPPSSRIAVSLPSPRNRSWIWSGV